MSNKIIRNSIFIFSAFVYTHLYAQQTEVQYLSGTGAEDTVSWDFYCSDGMNSKKWTSIEVPSCWEQQGFGQYHYGRDNFEDRLKEIGTYKRNFEVPKSWKSKEVKVVFEGVMTDATVKINGQLAGEVHQGAFYEFEYNITDLLKFGNQNTIEVKVDKFSNNESVNMAERKADFWIFGGIYRPVYLEALPKENIQRVAINANADGTFETDIFTSELKKGTNIEVQIQQLDGSVVTTFEGTLDGLKSSVSGAIDNPILWNPESPYMYQAVFNLKRNGNIIHQHKEKFAFRTVDIREHDGIYVNNVKVKLKGVNRHTFHPDFGRTSSKKLSIEAVKLMKEMNMNAVRMSHYPPEKHFLAVCDSLGLFVIDELTGWQKPAYDEVVGRKLVKELIRRDVNHPSIILWANGNEGGWNNALNKDFTTLDIQNREVIHPWQDYGKINTKHYISYNYMALDGYAKRSIFLPTEFLHGLYDGGHGAGLEDFWLRMWHHPLAAGGFLWVFADEGVSRSDRNGELDTDGNNAPDGILGPYMEKEASFYIIKKVWSPVFLEKKYITSKFDGNFNIENRYHFTNLNECKFLVEWIAYTNEMSPELRSNETIKLELEPNQKGKLVIALPKDWTTYHSLKISAIDENGDLINKWSYPIQKASDVSLESIEGITSVKVSLEDKSNAYNIKTKNHSFSFNKENGMLSSVVAMGEKIPLSNGPIFVSRDKEVDKVLAQIEKDGSVSIVTIYQAKKDSVIWNVKSDGKLDLKVAYEPEKNALFAGISFSFPEDNVSGMKWMGQGPYRVWKNRKQETSFGVWQKGYNNTITGHSGYVYPEFKGYHAEVFWVDVQTKNSPGFKVYVKSDDIFLRMLTPEFPEEGRNTIVKFPKGNISFLHGINTIGTKFKNPDKTGPQAEKYLFGTNAFYGKKLRMHLVFDFD